MRAPPDVRKGPAHPTAFVSFDGRVLKYAIQFFGLSYSGKLLADEKSGSEQVRQGRPSNGSVLAASPFLFAQ
jgi:hypothetical protein